MNDVIRLKQDLLSQWRDQIGYAQGEIDEDEFKEKKFKSVVRRNLQGSVPFLRILLVKANPLF